MANSDKQLKHQKNGEIEDTENKQAPSIEKEIGEKPSKRRIIEITPLDPLFFRDGKPFNMGDESWADGIFPPPPSVLYGALRSVYFSYHFDALKKANLTDDPTKCFYIKGIYLGIRNEETNKLTLHFPLPMDCVKEKNNNKNKSFVIDIVDIKDIISNCPTSHILLNKQQDEVENVENAVLSKSIFSQYLSNKIGSYQFIDLFNDNLFMEPKIGIGRENTSHTSDEGKLYRVGMRRFNNLSIIVEFTGLDELPPQGLLKIGGEGKSASYKEIYIDEIMEKKNRDDEVVEPPKNFQKDDTIFKLYLSTPAIFEKGWLPDWKWIKKNNDWEGEYKGLKLQLLTAAVGKPLYIGGFDIKNIFPKPQKRAVPPGSVYYFQLLNQGEKTMEDVCKIFHNTSISEYCASGYKNPQKPEESQDQYPTTSKQGFGICYVGGVKCQ